MSDRNTPLSRRDAYRLFAGIAVLIYAIEVTLGRRPLLALGAAIFSAAFAAAVMLLMQRRRLRRKQGTGA